MEIDTALFEQQALRPAVEADQFQVGIPRGLRVHASFRVAGGLRQGSKEIKVPVKTYFVKVDRGGNVRKAKEVLRQQSRPVSELTWYDQQWPQEQMSRRSGSPASPFQELSPKGSGVALSPKGSRAASPLPTMMENVLMECIDRCVFRRERIKRFGTHRQFPALVNKRLLPPWSHSDGATSSLTKVDHKDHLALPTVSIICKMQCKKTGDDSINTNVWKGGSSSQAQLLISDRAPTLFASTYYDQGAACAFRESGTVVLPIIRSEVKAANDSSRESLESEIAIHRERGRENIRTERVLYDRKRGNYNKECKAARLRNGGCADPFEARCRRVEEEVQQRAGHRRTAIPVAPPKTVIVKLVSQKSIGFSRFRSHTRQLPEPGA